IGAAASQKRSCLASFHFLCAQLGWSRPPQLAILVTRNVNVGEVPLYVRVVRALMKSIGPGFLLNWLPAISLTGSMQLRLQAQGWFTGGSGDFCFTRSAVACLSAF